MNRNFSKRLEVFSFALSLKNKVHEGPFSDEDLSRWSCCSGKIGNRFFFEPSLMFVLSEEQVLSVSIDFVEALYGQDSKYNQFVGHKEVVTK